MLAASPYISSYFVYTTALRYYETQFSQEIKLIQNCAVDKYTESRARKGYCCNDKCSALSSARVIISSWDEFNNNATHRHIGACPKHLDLLIKVLSELKTTEVVYTNDSEFSDKHKDIK